MKSNNLKHSRNILIIAVMVLTACVLFLLFTNQKVDLNSNVERRAYSDLQTANKSHAEYVNKLIGKEYSVLHTYSAYFGQKDDFNFNNELAFIQAAVLSNHYCSMGFADLEGNAINYTGKNVGNISEDQFFIDATRWLGEDSIEFKLKTISVDEPRILLGSPVRNKNVLIGILYAAMEIPDFNDKLISTSFDGNEIIFVTDSQGNIIMANANAEEHVVGTNLFESHFDTIIQGDWSKDEILSRLERGKDGQFQVLHNELEYVSFTPLEFGGWTIFSMVPASVVNTQYITNKQQVENILHLFRIAFVVAVAVACGMILLSNWFYCQSRRATHMDDEKYHKLYGALQSAVYGDDEGSPMHGYAVEWIFKDGDVYPLDANEKYLSFLGISQEESVNHSITFGFDEDEKQKVLKKLYSQATQRKDIAIDTCAVTKLGDKRQVHVQASFVSEQEKCPIYFGILTDVTNFVQAEKELKWGETAQNADTGSLDHEIPETEENADEIKDALKDTANLLDSTASARTIHVRTFGTFDVFVDGVPLCFTNSKAKELLAILIDRRGGTLTSDEAISLLWENEPAGDKQYARYRKLASRLKEFLDSAGCGDILITGSGIRSIDTSKIICDYYLALEGDENAVKQYQGDYMSNYSWAEERTATLNRLLGFQNT